MALPLNVKFLFKDLPIVTDEIEADYLELVYDLAARLVPTDRWQWRCIRQLADKYWELQRLQQYPHHLIQEGRREALQKILLGRDNNFARCTENTFFTDTRVRKDVLRELADYGLTDKSISARAFEVKRDVLTDCHRVMALLQMEITNILHTYEQYEEVKQLREAREKTIEGAVSSDALPAAKAGQSSK